MARSYGRVLTSIWRDEDFRALSTDARLMYVFLLSQDDLDHAGVIPLRVKRWSKSLAVAAADVEKMIGELDSARFTATDDDTEELLVRSLMRRDDVWKQPNVFKSGAAAAVACESARLKGIILAELRRIDMSEASADCRRIGAALAVALEPFANPSPYPSGTPPEGLPKGSGIVPDASGEPLANPPGMGKEIGRSSSLARVIDHHPLADARATPADDQDDDQSITQVADVLSERAGRPVTAAETRAVIAVILERATKGGTTVYHPAKYVLKAIKAERDVYDLILADVLALPAETVPGSHPYQHDRATGVCSQENCGLPQSNARHREVRSA